MAIHPDDRAAILADIQAGELGRNAIARKHQVSAGSVTLIAQQEGLEGAFDRSSMKTALDARTTDLAAERTRLAGLLMEDSFTLRERMWESQEEYFGSMAGPVRVTRRTNAAEYRNYLTAIGIAVDKVRVLTRDDTNGLAAVDSWLRSLTGAETTS